MMNRLDNARVIRAARGTALSARSWLTEAPLRMLMNNLDPEVAEHPSELVVYGGIGRAARDWQSFDRIVAALTRLGDDETLLVQSGKPVGVFRTQVDAPRVLIANSNLVPHWATWEHFNALDRKGLMMYGQMTAGSWIYIGSQGIVQGTYETFVEMGRQHYGSDLRGRWILTAGLGGMGGAQTLAATMAGACCLAVECRPSRIEMRLATGYVDVVAADLDDALRIIGNACRGGTPVSVALLGNAADILPELVRRGVRPDCVTDQTSAHDPVNGYLPKGWTLDDWETRRANDAAGVAKAAKRSMAEHVRAMLDFWKLGVPTIDYGNNIRQMALEEGVADAFSFPGFVPAYIRPLFCRGIGPFRWAALSGEPEDIFRTDAKVKELLPDNRHLHDWLDMAKAKIRFQGLPAGSAGWVWATVTGSASPSTTWWPAANCLRPSSSGAIISMPVPLPRPIARPKPCKTVRTRFPTGRCSMRCSTARPAQPGCRCIMAAALAWGSHSTPAWSLLPTAHRPPRGVWNECCGTIRQAASCAMPMPATTSLSIAPANMG